MSHSYVHRFLRRKNDKIKCARNNEDIAIDKINHIKYLNNAR